RAPPSILFPYTTLFRSAFPVFALCLFGFGLISMPINNAFSRWRERKADWTALDLTQNPTGFVRAMEKLASQNLADLSPHPVIELDRKSTRLNSSHDQIS